VGPSFGYERTAAFGHGPKMAALQRLTRTTDLARGCRVNFGREAPRPAAVIRSFPNLDDLAGLGLLMRQGREPCDAVYDGQSDPLSQRTFKMRLPRDDKLSGRQWLGVRRPQLSASGSHATLRESRGLAPVSYGCAVCFVTSVARCRVERNVGSPSSLDYIITRPGRLRRHNRFLERPR
jgi:hypothetical protein